MSKRITLLALSFVLCLLLLFIAACEAIPSYTYTEQGFIIYEEQGDRVYSNAKGSMYKGENFTLYVDKDMPSEVADKCVYYTEQILSAVSTERPIDVYLISDYEYIYSNDAQLIVGEIEYKSLDYITAVLVTVFGQYTNYGLTYGYANEIAASLGWQRNRAADFKAPTNADLNDLTTLCFDDQFVSADEVKLAQNNAISLVQWYLTSHSTADLETLIDNSNDIENLYSFNAVFFDFYSGNNTPYFPQTVLFNYGGRGCDYTVKNVYTELYMRSNWVEHNEPFTVDFLHRDYNGVKQFFEINTVQMTQFREYFGFGEYEDAPPIVFENTTDDRSYYSSSKIAVSSINDFTHEYVHSLTFARLKAGTTWDREGATTYFDNLFNFYGNQIGLMNTNKNPSNQFVAKLYTYFGRDIDWSRDWKTVYHIMAHYESAAAPSSYFTGASFVGYLMDTYGKERTLNYIYDTGRTAELIEKTYQELVKDWLRYLEKYR
jgi:hypothetical protein